jgi:hypothetical protein
MHFFEIIKKISIVEDHDNHDGDIFTTNNQKQFEISKMHT